MQKIRLKKRVLLISFLIGLTVSLSGLAPAQAFADQATAVTKQVLPVGQNTCASMPIVLATPYIYENGLHSLDIVIPDASYVALTATVGDTDIPFNQMTRRMEMNGSLRVHIDTATTPIAGQLPITVTLLSAKGPGQPVCLSIVTTSATAGSYAPIPQPTQTGATNAGPSTPAKPVKTATTSPVSTTSVATTTGGSAGACASSESASSLWVVLLVIYALIAGIATTGQFRSRVRTNTDEWASAAIVVPFLVLFGIWYVLESCRTGVWAPLIAILIALAALAAVYWRRRNEEVAVISLPAAQPRQQLAAKKSDQTKATGKENSN